MQNLLGRLLTLSGGIFYKFGTNFANINIALTMQQAGRRQKKGERHIFAGKKGVSKKHLQGEV